MMHVEITATINSLRAQLADVALADGAPIDLVLSKMPPRQKADITAYIEELEALIEISLKESGILPCRSVSGPSPGLAETIQKTLYYRPSEQLLLDAIVDRHPIVLATTVEGQRYIDCLTDYCNDPDRTQELWIWKGAAGLSELERIDAGKGVGNLRFAILQTSNVAEQVGDSPESVIAALCENFRERGGVRETINSNDEEISYWWRVDPDQSGAIEMLIEDHGAPENTWEILQQSIFQQVTDTVIRQPDLVERTAVIEPVTTFAQALTSAFRHKGSIIVIPDAHHFLSAQLNAPGDGRALLNVGALKDVYHRLLRAKRPAKVVLLCGDLTLPQDLREEVLRLELPLPSRRELFVAIRHMLGALVTDEDVVRLAEEAAGMTRAEVQAVLVRSEVGKEAGIDERLLSALRRAKRRHIARSPALELVETRGGADLGGMERFEAWLDTRRRAFMEPEKARRAGINRSPRGVLLLGIPGSGKSLAAKQIARKWMLPLVRLDMGALQDVWVGSSEARVREALRVVEAMAPCVMWIDEIDKGITQGEGVSSHSTDLNIRATLLTWMQESRFPVFIVATANRFASLPPELTRAGRFDARFFFGCPGPAGREQILKIHLRARGHDHEAFDLESLVNTTHGFTGAEIEQVVLDGLYAAFDIGKPLSDQALITRAKQIKPLIRSAGRGLDELWDLIEDGRVEMASDDMLSRAQVARLIDPHLYRPIYCRLEVIEGFKRHYGRAQRFLMSAPFSGPCAVVMETGEPDWLYVQTTIRLSPTDISTFKLLDEFKTLEQNFLFETLLTDHALEIIFFETERLQQRFQNSPIFSAYAELFKPV